MKRVLLLVLVVIMLIFPGDVLSQPAAFNWADIQDHWAQSDIELVSSLGLMNGTGTNGQGMHFFSPDASVTRAQLAVVLQHTFQLDCGQSRLIKQPLASDYYSDVDNKSWYADALVKCAINNIFEIKEDFSPGAPVSRLEAAQAIYRSFNAQGISVPMIMMMPVFEDTDSLTQEQINAIVFVNNTGIMPGKNDYFRPEQDMTRADLAQVLHRCVNILALDENYSGQEYQVSAGQTFLIGLNSNPSTGYSWSIKNGGNGDILALTGNTYQADATENQMIVGSGGKEYWQFKALQAGTADLQLVYARPWESVQPAQVFNLQVTATNSAAPEEALTISTKSVKSESEYMSVDLEIPVISGLTDKGIQSSINALFQKGAVDLENTLSAEIDSYVEYNQENDFPIRPYQLVTRYQKCFQSKNILSLYVDYYQYTGGAHGMTDRRPYNIDLLTGKTLALKDLFENGYDYQSVINAEVSRQIAADPDNYFPGSSGFNGIGEDQSYYIQAGYLVIYFSQYEIAPYAAGIPEFKIPMAKFNDGLKKKVPGT